MISSFRYLFGFNQLAYKEVKQTINSFVDSYCLTETGDGLGKLDQMMKPYFVSMFLDEIWPLCRSEDWTKAKLLHELDKRFSLLLK